MRRRPSRNRGGRFFVRGVFHVKRSLGEGEPRARRGGRGWRRLSGGVLAPSARFPQGVATGARAPWEAKKRWCPERDSRTRLRRALNPSLASSAGRSVENALPARFRLVDLIPARGAAIGGRCFAVCRAIEKMVPGAGVEPAHLSVAVFETAASAIPPSGRRTAVYRKPDAPSSVLRSDGRAASNVSPSLLCRPASRLCPAACSYSACTAPLRADSATTGQQSRAHPSCFGRALDNGDQL